MTKQSVKAPGPFVLVQFGVILCTCKLPGVKICKRLLLPQFSSNFNLTVENVCNRGEIQAITFSGDLANFESIYGTLKRSYFSYIAILSIRLCWFNLAKGQAQRQGPRASCFSSVNPLKVKVCSFFHVGASTPPSWLLNEKADPVITDDVTAEVAVEDQGFFDFEKFKKLLGKPTVNSATCKATICSRAGYIFICAPFVDEKM